jgi:hypothetical protein
MASNDSDNPDASDRIGDTHNIAQNLADASTDWGMSLPVLLYPPRLWSNSANNTRE